MFFVNKILLLCDLFFSLTIFVHVNVYSCTFFICSAAEYFIPWIYQNHYSYSKLSTEFLGRCYVNSACLKMQLWKYFIESGCLVIRNIVLQLNREHQQFFRPVVPCSSKWTTCQLTTSWKLDIIRLLFLPYFLLKQFKDLSSAFKYLINLEFIFMFSGR